jgi:hypothetical protein
MSKKQFSEGEFSMPAWLYQMSSGGSGGRWTRDYNDPTPWYPSDYREIVKERNKSEEFGTGKIYLRDQPPIAKGDTIIFFFCKTGDPDPKTGKINPGIYGWGKVIEPPIQRGDPIRFEVKPPSDQLKQKPLWDRDINQLMNEIRNKQYQGNIYFINSEQLQKLCDKLRQYGQR